MNCSEIRSTFLDFFSGKGHLVLPSYPLIPQDDPTLLLIGAGMAPLKPFFTGERKPPHPRLATCQKCVRTPDIERVGKTGRHATFFEMLGNFSFGDYFKEEAIAWSWELVVEGFKMSVEKLWVSIYEEDEEAFGIWHDRIGVPQERIVRLGKEDNFWEIGPGPCGPCSEIYFDLGPGAGCGREECRVGCDCDRYLEIWNLVFTQYNREPSGELITLKQKNIDTGAGLERMAMALQGVHSLYEIDLVSPLYKYFCDLAGGARSKQELPLRIVTEHSRGITFMVAGGVVPSNEGRGYVLRRLLRRAARFGRLLGIEGSFLAGSVPVVAGLMGDTYPELRERQDYIMQILKIEEDRFQETLAQGMDILEEYIETMRGQGRTVLPGNWAFKLYDTYGFPLDLTEEILAEQGITVDRDNFEKELSGQQSRARAARAASGRSGGSDYSAAETLETLCTGYEKLKGRGKVLLILDGGKPVTAVSEGAEVEIITDRTPFYAEAGGQVGDTGTISGNSVEAAVAATVLTPSEKIVHRARIESGTLRKGDTVALSVDAERRRGICRSHTATHLLHRSLKEQLGEHINQAGSLVAPDRLRFDFTHFAAPEEEQLQRTEENVNRLILRNSAVTASRMTLREARNEGAVALFAGKYDQDDVRVISTGDYGRELCGGTHVGSTGEIGYFRIVSEEGIGTGIRRIEAVTGLEAYRLATGDRCRLEKIAGMVNTNPQHLEHKLEELQEELRLLQKTAQDMKRQLAGYAVDSLLSAVKDAGGVNLISAQVNADSLETLRLITDQVKSRLPSAVVILGAAHNGKAMLVGAVTADLVKRGIRADEIIAAAAGHVGGGGGGRAELAQAGGKNPAALPEALESVEKLLCERQSEGVERFSKSGGKNNG